MVLFFIKNIKFIFTKKIFQKFESSLSEMIKYIIKEKGEEVISDRHQKDFNSKENQTSSNK